MDARTMPRVLFRVARVLLHGQAMEDTALPLCVVLAEDDDRLCELVALALEDDRIQVVSVASGEALIDEVRKRAFTDRHPVDLVISDLRILRTSALSSIRLLRDAGLSAPIVMMTDLVDDVTRLAAQSSDAYFVEKPVSLAMLRSVARDALGLGLKSASTAGTSR